MDNKGYKAQGIKNIIKILIDKGAAHITLGSFATKFVGMIGSIVVVRILTKADYGLLSYVENIYGYVFIFAGLGLSNAMLRYVVKAEDGMKGTYYHYIYKNSLLLDIVLVFVSIFVNAFINYPSDFSDAKFLLSVLAFLIPCQDMLNNGLFALRSGFKAKDYAYWSFGVSAILIAGRIVGAYLAAVNGVILSRIVINGIFAVLLFLYTKKIFQPKKSASCLPKEKRKEVFVYSVQYMITNGIWTIFMLNDVFILSLFVADSTVVADFKVAYTLPAAISLFSTSIGIFVAPYFTKNEENRIWVQKNYKYTFLITAGIVGVVALLMIVLAKPIILLLYGTSYINIVSLMRVLTGAAFCNAGLRFTSANLLAAMGKIRYNMIISILGMFLQIVLDVILVQVLAEYGIALSSCIVYLFMAIMLLILFRKEYY